MALQNTGKQTERERESERERARVKRKRSEHLSASFSSYTARDEASLEGLISAAGRTLSCSNKHGARIERGGDGQIEGQSESGRERDGTDAGNDTLVLRATCCVIPVTALRS